MLVFKPKFKVEAYGFVLRKALKDLTEEMGFPRPRTLEEVPPVVMKEWERRGGEKDGD